MTFTEIQTSIKMIELIINKQMKLENVAYQEDITDREVRDLMQVQSYLRSSICGSNGSEMQSYWFNKAMNICNEMGLYNE